MVRAKTANKRRKLVKWPDYVTDDRNLLDDLTGNVGYNQSPWIPSTCCSLSLGWLAGWCGSGGRCRRKHVQTRLFPYFPSQKRPKKIVDGECGLMLFCTLLLGVLYVLKSFFSRQH